MKTTEEKEKELAGKRYKIISMSIESQRELGEKVTHEMEIDLHHAWMRTISDVKKDFNIRIK